MDATLETPFRSHIDKAHVEEWEQEVHTSDDTWRWDSNHRFRKGMVQDGRHLVLDILSVQVSDLNTTDVLYYLHVLWLCKQRIWE